MRKAVKIRKDDLVGECQPSSLPVWEANGWTLVDDSSSEAVEPDSEANEHEVTKDNEE